MKMKINNNNKNNKKFMMKYLQEDQKILKIYKCSMLSLQVDLFYKKFLIEFYFI